MKLADRKIDKKSLALQSKEEEVRESNVRFIKRDDRHSSSMFSRRHASRKDSELFKDDNGEKDSSPDRGRDRTRLNSISDSDDEEEESVQRNDQLYDQILNDGVLTHTGHRAPPSSRSNSREREDHRKSAAYRPQASATSRLHRHISQTQQSGSDSDGNNQRRPSSSG